jgi:hypothetical protein
MWIDRRIAEAGRLRRVDSFTCGQLVGRKGGNFPGLAIPYVMPGSPNVREYRLRRDRPDLEADRSGQLKPKRKYLSPPGRGNMLYLVPGVPKDDLANVSLPIVLTEGEFKTLALWRLATWASEQEPWFLPMGISGVFNWRGTIGKASGADGERIDVKGPIPDLDWIVWEGRRVIIAFRRGCESERSSPVCACRFGPAPPRPRRFRWISGMEHRPRSIGLEERALAGEADHDASPRSCLSGAGERHRGLAACAGLARSTRLQ